MVKLSWMQENRENYENHYILVDLKTEGLEQFHQHLLRFSEESEKQHLYSYSDDLITTTSQDTTNANVFFKMTYIPHF